LSDSNISYTEASNMDEEEIMEANAALDIKQEEMKKKQPKKKGGRRK